MRQYMKNLTLPIIAFGMMMGGITAAKAEVAFDTLVDIGNTFNGVYYANDSFTPGMQFSPNFDVDLTSVSAMMRHESGGDTMYTYSLYADNGANQLGALLGAVTDEISNNSFQDVAFDFSGLNLTLLASENYWLVISGGEDGSFGNWRHVDDKTLSYSNDIANNTVTYPTRNAGIMSIEGTRVTTQASEPALLSLFGSALLLTGFLAKRRQK